jgi:hypothetical protein
VLKQVAQSRQVYRVLAALESHAVCAVCLLSDRPSTYARGLQYEQVLHSTLGCVFDSTPSHLSVEIFTRGKGRASIA